MTSITIRLNGEIKNIPSQNLQDFLQEFYNSNKYFAVAINDHVIPSAEYPTTILHDNDCVEIIQPVCGG